MKGAADRGGTMISPETKLFAVFGHPISHSLSPAMHNAAFEALGMDALYLAFDVAPGRLMRTLEVVAELGFRGINLTVPLKEEAFKGIPDLSDSARALRSVNTVRFTPRGLEGHSTDGEGFLLGIKEAFELDVHGISMFVIGCGGAGRAVALASAMNGAGALAVTDLDAGRARQLGSELSGLMQNVTVIPTDTKSWTRASQEADLVVQATPVGMKRTDSPLLGAPSFRPGQYVYDLIYMFPETAFMKEARSAGALVSNGLGMLLYQGALAFSLWTDAEAPIETMRNVLERAVRSDKG